jgi:3-hydroxyisobutyrate dehydrogenase
MLPGPKGPSKRHHPILAGGAPSGNVDGWAVAIHKHLILRSRAQHGVSKAGSEHRAGILRDGRASARPPQDEEVLFLSQVRKDQPMTKPAIVPPAAVTVIGLGNMGVPMAMRLVGAGFAVTGFDIAEAARGKFDAAGGRTEGTPAAAVAAADVVVTLLPNGKVVREAVTGMRPHLKPASILVEMSSSDPIGTRKLGEELIAAGFEFVDAPVSGGVKRAVNGTLAIMVGGAAATVDRIAALLAAMGTSIFRTGALGTGHAMKALNNYVSAAGLIAAVEALQVGRSFGLDPALMTDILNVSSGRNNTTEHKLKQFIISQSFDAGFPLRLMAKDVRTADDMAHALGIATPLADQCAELWDAAARALDETADHTEIIRFLERLPGP